MVMVFVLVVGIDIARRHRGRGVDSIQPLLVKEDIFGVGAGRDGLQTLPVIAGQSKGGIPRSTTSRPSSASQSKLSTH